LKEIQKDHPTAESLIPDTRKNLEAIRQFLLDHHIVTFFEVRARVEETPQFERATSFASMDTPVLRDSGNRSILLVPRSKKIGHRSKKRSG